MKCIEVCGEKHLRGEVKIQGSKNAVLPILAGCILNKGITKLNNCPKIVDVYNMIKILEDIGSSITWEGSSLVVDTTDLNSNLVSGKHVKEMRSSIIVLGALLGRLSSVSIAYPGGCSIGARPIDLHLSSLLQLNVEISEADDLIDCKTTGIKGNDIFLDFPSVGATENIILAAVLSEGLTRIYNPAREPEINQLCDFLNNMGAKIQGGGTRLLKIKGVKRLHESEYTLVADRIVTGTYLAAVAGSGGKVNLTNVNELHSRAIIKVLTKMGCKIRCGNDFVGISCNTKPLNMNEIKTAPFPGFPTDMQSQIMAVLTLAKGTSVIVENIFEDRYKTANELIKMNANIKIIDNKAIIKGVERLVGQEVNAHDLRGGAALIIAGLMAQGKTTINKAEYIERGYEDICRDLSLLGANIKILDRG